MRSVDVPGCLTPLIERNIRIVALVPESAEEAITGQAVMTALGDEPPRLLAISVRSGELLEGLSVYFQTHPQHWTTTTIAVRSSYVEPVISRAAAAARSIITVDQREAPLRMRELWKWAHPRPGPTSGLAYAGVMKYVRALLINDGPMTGWAYRNDFTAAFLCSDLLATRLK